MSLNASHWKPLTLGAARLATLLACSGPPDASADEPVGTAEGAALATRVVGYFPTWAGDVNTIQYDKLTGRCVDIAGPSSADGARVQQWGYGGGANQQLRAVSLGNGYHRLEARHSGKVLDVANCWSSGNGTLLQQWVWSNNDCQQFRLEPL